MKKLEVDWISDKVVQIEIEEEKFTLFIELTRNEAQDFLWKLQEVVNKISLQHGI